MLRLTPPGESDSGRVPKACVPCAHAKVKCEIEAGEKSCQRCCRLNKMCSMQRPGAHRRKRPNTSDVARLEHKLDGVAAILAASERLGAGRELESQLLLSNPAVPGQPGLLSPTVCVKQFITSDSEADSILDVFRKEMAPHFPFVVLSPSMNLEELRQQKPFLFMVVMMAGCRHDVSQQTAMARKLREVISYNMLIKGERSLDLLQGLLIYLSWYHIHMRIGSQLTNLLHLMMAMMTDLGLNKPTNPKSFSKPSLGVIRYFDGDGQASAARTLEERRAFLGCFYISSIISMCARDIDPIRYSKYADECCRAIAEAAEYPTDVYLVNLMSLHRLADKIRRTLAYDEFDSSLGISAPIGACVKSLEGELRQLKSSLPLDIPQTAVLFLHYYNVELVLYEVALNDSIDPVRYGNYPMARLNILFACLDSTKSCLDTFYSLPSSVFFDIPYTLWSQLGHAIIILSRLSLFDGEGWDLNYVRSTLDFSETVDKFGHRLEEAKASTELPAGQMGNKSLPRGIPELFSKLTPKLQQMKERHEMKRVAQINRSEASQVHSSDGNDLMPDDQFAMPGTASLFEFLDDSFWQEFT